MSGEGSAVVVVRVEGMWPDFRFNVLPPGAPGLRASCHRSASTLAPVSGGRRLPAALCPSQLMGLPIALLWRKCELREAMWSHALSCSSWDSFGPIFRALCPSTCPAGPSLGLPLPRPGSAFSLAAASCFSSSVSFPPPHPQSSGDSLGSNCSAFQLKQWSHHVLDLLKTYCASGF